MEVISEILCPWCGQRIQIPVDTSQGFHRFVTDCEVCCRPIEVTADGAPGENPDLEVGPG